ncbi:hypothetical protein [Levilactobacillus parabrevis]|nr:hypothetical protein [Levilactobacillus parabrevis]
MKHDYLNPFARGCQGFCLLWGTPAANELTYTVVTADTIFGLH